MLLQTNSYIVPKEKRAEHSRLLRRFRAALAKLGCDNFEVYEQVSANWSGSDSNGRYVQIMRFRNRQHQVEVQQAERNDPAAQALIREFCELINFPYQQQQGLFAVGYYTSVFPVAPSRENEMSSEGSADSTPPPAEFAHGAPMAAVETPIAGTIDQVPREVAQPLAPVESPAAEEEEIFASPAHPIQSESALPEDSQRPIEDPEHHLESAPAPAIAIKSTTSADNAIWKELPKDDEGIITELPTAAESTAVEPLSFDMPEVVEPAEASSKHPEQLETQEEELVSLDSEAIGETLDRALETNETQFDPAPGQTEKADKNGALDDDAALEALSGRQFDEPPPGHEIHAQELGDFNGQNGNGKVGHKT